MNVQPRTALLAMLSSSLLSLVLHPHSPHAHAQGTPIPRLWLQDLQQQSFVRNCRLVGLLRSQPLISGDGRWQVYSRITYEITPVGLGRLSSVLFAQDNQTQQLQTIYNPSSIFREGDELGLDFLFLLPMEWRNGQVLVREYSGLFRSQAILNRAVLWSPEEGGKPAQLTTRTPDPQFPATVLLGWDSSSNDRVLFAVSDFLDLPQVIAIGDREVQVKPDIPPPDWMAISASVDLEREVSDAELEAEVASWTSGWPAITGQLCSSPSE